MKKGEQMSEEKKAEFKAKIAKGKAEAKAKREAAQGNTEEASPIILDTNIEAAQKEAVAPVIKTSSKIMWFTEVDLNDKGRVANDMPAYYDYKNIEELGEKIRNLEVGLEDGLFIGPKKREKSKQLDMLKNRLNKINEGKPKLTGAEKDQVYKAVQDLEKSIREKSCSYDEAWKQTADPQEEARMMVKPCIKIPNEMVGDYAKQRGFNIKDGMISRDHAKMICKVMARVIEHRVNLDYR